MWLSFSLTKTLASLCILSSSALPLSSANSQTHLHYHCLHSPTIPTNLPGPPTPQSPIPQPTLSRLLSISLTTRYPRTIPQCHLERSHLASLDHRTPALPPLITSSQDSILSSRPPAFDTLNNLIINIGNSTHLKLIQCHTLVGCRSLTLGSDHPLHFLNLLKTWNFWAARPSAEVLSMPSNSGGGLTNIEAGH